MFDNGDRWARRILFAWQPSLLAGACIRQRVLVRRVRERSTRTAHANTSFVHHLEHAGESMVRFADQLTNAFVVLAEVENRARRATPSHLVNQSAEHHAVRYWLALRVGAVARHQHERDTAHTQGRASDTCQHHVDDVLRHFVLAPGDPHLGAGDSIAACRVIRTGRCGECAQVGE